MTAMTADQRLHFLEESAVRGAEFAFMEGYEQAVRDVSDLPEDGGERAFKRFIAWRNGRFSTGKFEKRRCSIDYALGTKKS